MFQSALNLQDGSTNYRDRFLDESLGGGSLLEQEMRFLVEKNGCAEKLDFGPRHNKKDLWDCVSVVTTRLLEENLKAWKAKMLSISLTASDAGTFRTVG